uniref:Putative tick defensin n=1 Tax=Rhipicephalus pulchellus TaxID=72859 RepID=L7MCJ9_RHIPC
MKISSNMLLLFVVTVLVAVMSTVMARPEEIQRFRRSQSCKSDRDCQLYCRRLRLVHGECKGHSGECYCYTLASDFP